MLATLASRDFDLCARTVKLLAAGEPEELRAALACALRNRIVTAWKKASSAPLDICQDFIQEATGARSELLNGPGEFDAEWCRAMAMNCLVWSGDLADPTNGATSCHRHDVTASWDARRAPTALIGAYIFLR